MCVDTLYTLLQKNDVTWEQIAGPLAEVVSKKIPVPIEVWTQILGLYLVMLLLDLMEKSKPVEDGEQDLLAIDASMNVFLDAYLPKSPLRAAGGDDVILSDLLHPSMDMLETDFERKMAYVQSVFLRDVLASLVKLGLQSQEVCFKVCQAVHGRLKSMLKDLEEPPLTLTNTMKLCTAMQTGLKPSRVQDFANLARVDSEFQEMRDSVLAELRIVIDKDPEYKKYFDEMFDNIVQWQELYCKMAEMSCELDDVCMLENEADKVRVLTDCLKSQPSLKAGIRIGDTLHFDAQLKTLAVATVASKKEAVLSGATTYLSFETSVGNLLELAHFVWPESDDLTELVDWAEEYCESLEHKKTFGAISVAFDSTMSALASWENDTESPTEGGVSATDDADAGDADAAKLLPGPAPMASPIWQTVLLPATQSAPKTSTVPESVVAKAESFLRAFDNIVFQWCGTPNIDALKQRVDVFCSVAQLMPPRSIWAARMEVVNKLKQLHDALVKFNALGEDNTARLQRDDNGDHCAEVIRSLEVANESRKALEAREFESTTYIHEGEVSLLNPKAVAFLKQSQLDLQGLIRTVVGDARDNLSSMWEKTHALANGASEDSGGNSWKFEINDKMKLPTVRKIAKAKLMKLDVQFFINTFDQLRELQAEYEAKCTKMNIEADVALLEKAEKTAETAKVTEAEWLLCALLDSTKRDSEEKRKKAHQIKKRVLDMLPGKKTDGHTVVKPDGWSLVLSQLQTAAVELMSTA